MKFITLIFFLSFLLSNILQVTNCQSPYQLYYDCIEEVEDTPDTELDAKHAIALLESLTNNWKQRERLTSDGDAVQRAEDNQPQGWLSFTKDVLVAALEGTGGGLMGAQPAALWQQYLADWRDQANGGWVRVVWRILLPLLLTLSPKPGLRTKVVVAVFVILAGTIWLRRTLVRRRNVKEGKHEPDIRRFNNPRMLNHGGNHNIFINNLFILPEACRSVT